MSTCVEAVVVLFIRCFCSLYISAGKINANRGHDQINLFFLSPSLQAGVLLYYSFEYLEEHHILLACFTIICKSAIVVSVNVCQISRLMAL